MRRLDGVIDLIDMSLSKLQELVMMKAWRAAVHGVTVRHDLATELNHKGWEFMFQLLEGKVAT